jgi:uncharacterized protein YbcI
MKSIEPSLRPDLGLAASEISREIVRLHARLFGRGPTKAKTFLEDDYALCILEDVFTPAEHTLIRAGREDQVQATRAAFQTAVESDFVTIVEIATRRKVRCFMSEVHIGAGAAAELFLLEPKGAAEEDGSPATDAAPANLGTPDPEAEGG